MRPLLTSKSRLQTHCPFFLPIARRASTYSKRYEIRRFDVLDSKTRSGTRLFCFERRPAVAGRREAQQAREVSESFKRQVLNKPQKNSRTNDFCHESMSSLDGNAASLFKFRCFSSLLSQDSSWRACCSEGPSLRKWDHPEGAMMLTVIYKLLQR